MSVASKDMPGGYYDPYDLHGSKDSTWGTKLKGNDAAWHNAITALAAAGYDVDAIYSMLSGYLSSKKGQSAERNDMFYQYLLGQTSLQNQRDFDKKVLDEQRLYDLPSNALDRLLATGMSRDAALSVLGGGSGSGSGSGSPLIGSGIGAADAQVSAPSGTMDLQTAQTAINGVTQITDAMCNMVNTGMNATVAYEQAQLLSAQTTFTKNQNNALALTGQAYDVVSKGVANGLIEDDGHLFDSVSNVNVALKELAAAGDVNAKNLIDSGFSDKMAALAPFTSSYLGELYKSERAGQDYDTSFSKNMNLLDAEYRMRQVNADSLAKGIEKADAEIQQIVQDIEVKKEQIQLYKAQEALFRKQGKVAEAEAALKRQQALAQALENNYEIDFQTTEVDGATGLQMTTGARTNRMYMDWQTLARCRNEKQWEKEAMRIISDADAAVEYNKYRHWYYKAGNDIAANPQDPRHNLFNACAAMEECGFWSYIDGITKMNQHQQSTHVGLNGVTFEESGVIGREDGVWDIINMTTPPSSTNRNGAVRRLGKYLYGY